MAVCWRCKGAMKQTQAICPHCGYDFPPPAAPATWFGIFARQSTLRSWLIVIGVLCIPLAFWHYVEPTSNPSLVAYGLAIVGLLCARLLRDAAPGWSTLFEAATLMALLAVFIL